METLQRAWLQQAIQIFSQRAGLHADVTEPLPIIQDGREQTALVHASADGYEVPQSLCVDSPWIAELGSRRCILHLAGLCNGHKAAVRHTNRKGALDHGTKIEENTTAKFDSLERHTLARFLRHSVQAFGVTTPSPRLRLESWDADDTCPGVLAVPELGPGVGCLCEGVPEVPDCDVDAA